MIEGCSAVKSACGALFGLAGGAQAIGYQAALGEGAERLAARCLPTAAEDRGVSLGAVMPVSQLVWGRRAQGEGGVTAVKSPSVTLPWPRAKDPAGVTPAPHVPIGLVTE